MFDLKVRPVKERLLRDVCRLIPSAITPTQLTLIAFLLGLASCYTAAFDHRRDATSSPALLPVALWLLNRLLDCLDGSLARSRSTASELGGFLDLLCDFIVYSLIPIAVAHGEHSRRVRSKDGLRTFNTTTRMNSQGSGMDSVDWSVIAFLEATFHINNFVLLYVAAIEAKISSSSHTPRTSDELTSLTMRPALVEGLESAVFFTLMLIFPRHVECLAGLMGCAVVVGIVQRVCYTVSALQRVDQGRFDAQLQRRVM